MNLITLDMETFYDRDFSLSKITTEEYIRSPKFETIGVSVKVNNEPAMWYTGDFKGTKKFLQSFDIPNNAVCAHNANFDGAILNWVYGIKPARIIDTVSMANVLHGINKSVSLKNLAVLYNIGEKGQAVHDALGKRRLDFTPADLAKYGEYCINDVELTYTLARFMMPQFSKKELKLIDLTIRMFTEPALKLDKKLLEQALHDLALNRRNLMYTLMNELGVKNEELLKKQLMSNDKFAELLKENGVEPPKKISGTTNKETWAFAKTDEEFTLLEDHPNPIVQALFAARMGFKSTIGITRTEAFLSIAERGTFPFPLKYSGASVTHRWSGFDVNPQNLSRIDPDNPKPNDALRYAIHAPKGYKLVVADLSNIELRLGLWLAGQHDKLQLIRDGIDLYRDFAAEAYGIPYDSIGKKDPMRFVGKCCISEGTPVLCESGWKPIEQVLISDKVWDGGNWVCHQGLVDNGWKKTVSLCGSLLTPDHQVWEGREWLEAQQILANENTLSQALGFATDNLPSQDTFLESSGELKRSLFNVIVGDLNIRLTSIILNHLKQHDVDFAGHATDIKNVIGVITPRYLTHPIAVDYLEDLQLQLTDVITQTTKDMLDMGVVELVSAMSGEQIKQHFSDMFKHSLIGIIQNTKWTEQTITEIMRPVTFDSLAHQKTCSINEKLMTLNKKSHVYDLSLAGPLHRFTILTGAGPIIVHNCSLSLIYGTGAEKLQNTIRIQSKGANTVTSSESATLTKLYRTGYNKVVETWGEGSKMLDALINKQTRSFCNGDVVSIGSAFTGAAKFLFDETGLVKPNGMVLTYPDLKKSFNKETGKSEYTYEQRHGRDKVYGAKVFQRVTQSLARDIMAEIIIGISKKYHVVGTVHDEVLLLVPETQAEPALEELLTLMRTPPEWAPDLPLDGEGGIAESYGEAK